MGKATGDGLMSDPDEGIQKQLPDQFRSLYGCHNMFTGIQLRAAIVFWLHYLVRNILEGVRTALTAPAKRNRMLDLGAARNRVKRFLLSATLHQQNRKPTVPALCCCRRGRCTTAVLDAGR